MKRFARFISHSTMALNGSGGQLNQIRLVRAVTIRRRASFSKNEDLSESNARPDTKARNLGAKNRKDNNVFH